jgi:hypothetical protein
MRQQSSTDINLYHKEVTQPIPQRTVAPPGPSPSLWPEESIALPTPSGVLYPQSSRRSSLRASEDRVSRTREPCAHLARCETPIPDPRVHGQRPNPVGDFPIGKSAYERSLGTHLSKPRMSMRDATCRPPLRLRGTRRNSGLRCSSVLPSTSKTPKCRVSNPRDLVPPVPPTTDGSD